MKKEEALMLGKATGLNTVELCVLNAIVYSSTLFPYHTIRKELEELIKDTKKTDPNALINLSNLMDELKGMFNDVCE